MLSNSTQQLDAKASPVLASSVLLSSDGEGPHDVGGVPWGQ